MFAPATVFLKASASFCSSLKPATAAPMPSPAMAPPTGPMAARTLPNAETPALPASDIFVPRPFTAESIWPILPVFTPNMLPRDPSAWPPILSRSFSPCLTSLAPLSKSWVSAPMMTFMLGSFCDISYQSIRFFNCSSEAFFSSGVMLDRPPSSGASSSSHGKGRNS